LQSSFYLTGAQPLHYARQCGLLLNQHQTLQLLTQLLLQQAQYSLELHIQYSHQSAALHQERKQIHGQCLLLEHQQKHSAKN
jgi:hypothetical protein